MPAVWELALADFGGLRLWVPPLSAPLRPPAGGPGPGRVWPLPPGGHAGAAQEGLLGVALAAFVGEQDAGSQLEEVGRVGVRHLRELGRLDLEVRRSAARHRPLVDGPGGDDVDLLFAAVGAVPFFRG